MTNFIFDLQRFDSSFSGGSGTQADPYKISSQADLEQLAKDVNTDGFTRGNNYQGKYFKVTNDIALNGNWTTIGTMLHCAFKGTFDGDGHVISNLTINRTEGFSYSDGFFGYVCDGATVKNVHLTNVNINSNSANVGGLCAYADGYAYHETYVSNCSVQGTITGTGGNIGGICGDNNAFVSNNAFIGTVSKVGNAGIIIGAGSSAYLTNNYYCSDVSGINTNGATRIFKLNLPNGVTANETLTFGGNSYVKSGEVTLNFDGETYKYNVTGDVTVTFKDNKIYANDTALGTVFPATLEGNGSESNPYLIKDEKQLRQFAAYVNRGNDCAGVNFKLANDIKLNGTWTPVGTSSKKFKGTFDGNGKTVSNIKIDTSNNYQGLFGCVEGATIKNVNLTGVDIKAKDHVGALVGTADEGTQIINCSAQGNIKATGMVRAYVGGLIGYVNKDVTVDGCTFSGNVEGKTLPGYVASSSGGLVGFNYGGTIKNSVFLGGTIIGGTTDGKRKGAIVGENESTLTDNYYCGTLADGLNDNGATRIFRVSLPKNVTSNEIVEIGGRKYIKGGDVTFTFNGQNYPYTVKDDITVTLQGYKIFINNAAFSDNFPGNLDGDGSEKNPFLIKTEENFQQLATYVNYGNKCADMHFKLANDITLKGTWTPIGTNSDKFSGTFDGDGKTVSNITIDDASNDNQGLFGQTEGATIKNINLANVNVTGKNNVGALVGSADNNTQIINCTVQGNVKGSENVGGLVGLNSGTIKNGALFGGTIDGTTKGAIAGNNGGTLTDNYYYGTLADGVNDNGAKQIFKFSMPENVTSNAQVVEINGTKYIKGGNVTFTFNGKNYSCNVTDDITVTLKDNKLFINDAEPDLSFPYNLDGGGSENNPYLIKDESQLRQLTAYVNSGNKCDGLNFKLANDIKLNGIWTPIGTDSHEFKSTFDGGGKIISGLTIGEGDVQGLFGYINGATIKNVNLTDVKTAGQHYLFRVGALVASTGGNSQIVNCSAQGNVETAGPCSFVGGLIGCIKDSTTVDGCTFSGNVKGFDLPKSPIFGSYVGGVVGFYLSGTIKNCAYLGGTLKNINSAIIAARSGETATLADSYYLGKLEDGVNDNGAKQIFNVTMPKNVTSNAIVDIRGTKYIKAGETTFTYGGKNYSYNVTGDISVTLKDNKIFIGDEELKSASKLTVAANENSMLKSSVTLMTFSASSTDNDIAQGKKLYADDNGSTLTGTSGNDSLWGGAGKDTFIYNGGNDVIYGFGDGDSLKVNGIDDITATYNAEDNYIRIPCGTGSVTLKDFTTNEFAINNDTWKLSGNTVKAMRNS